MQQTITNCFFNIFTARKRSLRWLCFYTCQSVILFTGGCLFPGVGLPGPGGSTPGGCLLLGDAWSHGGVWSRGDPPRRLLLRVVRILLECILVHLDKCESCRVCPLTNPHAKLFLLNFIRKCLVTHPIVIHLHFEK